MEVFTHTRGLTNGKIILELPVAADEAGAADYIAEHIAHGELTSHGTGGLFDEPYHRWLAMTLGNMRPETVRPGLVTATTFFARRIEDGRIIGMIQVRHELNAYLLQYGGHIGYGVRPGERRKGYATQMLGLALQYCVRLCIRRALVTCNLGNLGSSRTILACGGVLENEVTEENGEILQRYWITLP